MLCYETEELHSGFIQVVALNDCKEQFVLLYFCGQQWTVRTVGLHGLSGLSVQSLVAVVRSKEADRVTIPATHVRDPPSRLAGAVWENVTGEVYNISACQN